MAAEHAKTYRATTFYYVMLGLLVALAFAATMLIQIPVGLGYVNFGDAVVMIAGVVMGPVGGAVTGLLGPTIADLATGYFIYAPFTAVIKGFEGLLCGLLYKKLLTNRAGWLRCLVAFAVASVWVTVGYAMADFLLVSFGVAGFDAYGFKAALLAGAVTMPGTLVQMGVSLVVATAVSPKLPKLAYGKLFADTAVSAPDAQTVDEAAQKGQSADQTQHKN